MVIDGKSLRFMMIMWRKADGLNHQRECIYMMIITIWRVL